MSTAGKIGATTYFILGATFATIFEINAYKTDGLTLWMTFCPIIYIVFGIALVQQINRSEKHVSN